MKEDPDVADYFVAATAARLPEGAAESVHRTAEERDGGLVGEPWRQAQFLAERAALHWAPRALRSGGCHVEAEALKALGISQASYVAQLIDDEYRPNLEQGSDAELCCREAAAALVAANGLVGATEKKLLRLSAANAGHALAACFLAGGVNSVPDQVAEALDLLAQNPRGGSSLSWD